MPGVRENRPPLGAVRNSFDFSSVDSTLESPGSRSATAPRASMCARGSILNVRMMDGRGS